MGYKLFYNYTHYNKELSKSSSSLSFDLNIIVPTQYQLCHINVHTEKCSLGKVILLLLFIIPFTFKNSDFIPFWGVGHTQWLKYIINLLFPCGLLFHLSQRCFIKVLFRYNLWTINLPILRVQFNELLYIYRIVQPSSQYNFRTFLLP